MSSPLVSVIVPTYNRANLVGRAVDSVLAQTYGEFELLVVDDASTDDTQSVVEGYDDDRVSYIRHETNRHVSAARNTGLAAAGGEYVAFLDDDDEWRPTKLEKQVELLEGAPGSVGLVYCWMDYRRDGELLREYRPTLSGDVFAETLDGQPIGNASTLVVRSAVVDDVGGFDEELPRGNDGDFIRRVAREYEVDYVPETLVDYHVGHEHERITSEDEAGIRNAIRGQEVKFEKFGDALQEFPTRRANVHAKLGFRYGQLGEWDDARANFAAALRAGPTSPQVYLSAIRLAGSFLPRRLRPGRTGPG